MFSFMSTIIACFIMSLLGAPVNVDKFTNKTNHTKNQTYELFGGCYGTEYGCCKDNVTFCEEHCLNCPEVVNVTFSKNYLLNNTKNHTYELFGGCYGAEYGCCKDNVTFCEEHCLNCPIIITI
jgi:hypothetical protein